MGHSRDLAGNAPAALRLFEEAVRRNPQEPLGWYNLGDALLEVSRPAEAALALARAVALAPSSALFRYDLGLALHRLERFAEAEEHLRAALGSDPLLARGRSAVGVNAAVTLALCQDARGEVAAAVATLEPARSLAVSILYNLGRLKLTAGDAEGASPCLLAAALIAPDEEDVRHLAGAALMQLGRGDEAEEHLAHATRLDPACVGAWYDRGCNLARAKRPASPTRTHGSKRLPRRRSLLTAAR